MRKQFELNHVELSQFRRLKPDQGVALAFWARVALSRDLDPESVISNGMTFTALPQGHGKHWCWPLPLKCKKQPVYRD
jgi:hypothetical protein